jgi:acyl dehydratase
VTSADTIQPEFMTEAIGQWSAPTYWVTDRDALLKYAKAVHASAPSIASGSIAHPVYNAIPAMTVCDPMLSRIIPVEIKLSGLHGESDMYFHRPLEPDMELVNRATGIGFRPVGAGVIAIAKGETRTMDGDLVNEQWVTIILRGAATAQPVGGDRPVREVPRGRDIATFETTFDRDTPTQYAKASGDYWPIHTNKDFAQQSGLPGIINHGLCTLAFVSNDLIARLCDDDPARLKRLATRFGSIVMPTETLATTVFEGGERDGRTLYGFNSLLADGGKTALRDGVVEVA